MRGGSSSCLRKFSIRDYVHRMWEETGELLMEFWWNCASIWECSLKRGRIRKESGERERESRVLVRGTFCRTLDEMQERIWTSRRGGVRYLRISEAVGRSRWLDEEVCFLTLKCDKIVLIIFFAPGDNCQASSLLLGKREKERLKMWIDDGILAIVSLQAYIYVLHLFWF
jgi:hypothetical protein